MQAIILAAGLGRRLGELTAHNTKCMIEVNGVRLIDRLLQQLHKFNITKIIIVTGYEGEQLKNHVIETFPSLNVSFINNPIYDKTNNIYSLWLTREKMKEDDLLLLESDLIFEDEILKKIIESKHNDCALVSKYQSWMDGTMVRIDDEDNIINFIPKKAFKYKDSDSYYKTVNIYKFSREFITGSYLPFLEAYIKVLGENEYYEQVLRVITLIDNVGIKAVKTEGLKWYEIDDVQDLKIAETIFASPEKRLEKLQKSYGGYWRYPGLLDFSNTTNPCFPTKRLIEELEANFEVLLRNYPSVMEMNTLLASKYFGIDKNFIVVCNEKTDLILKLSECLKGSIGLINPTFENNIYFKSKGNLLNYLIDKDAFKYKTENIIDIFTHNTINNIFIANPDNFSGNLVHYNDLIKLLEWAKLKNINIIIDETYIDFTNEGRGNSLLKNAILKKYPNLIILNSFSNSSGVPGLQLSMLFSSNLDLIGNLRKDVISRTSSIAEFYLQIIGKYERDYYVSCQNIKKERDHLYSELKKLSFLHVYSSESIYFLCKITNTFSNSFEFTKFILSSQNILIRDLSSIIGNNLSQYIQISIRNKSDNDKLISALHKII